MSWRHKRIAELLLLGPQNGRTKLRCRAFRQCARLEEAPSSPSQKADRGRGPGDRRLIRTCAVLHDHSEACQLVLQAAIIGEGGQICVLDMGGL